MQQHIPRRGRMYAWMASNNGKKITETTKTTAAVDSTEVVSLVAGAISVAT